MCPDRQLLSIYVDGEMPSPWKERMESHLDSCTPCSATEGTFRAISSAFADTGTQNLEAAKARVWRALSSSTRFQRSPASWRRPLVMPLPAAIAAVLAVAVITVLVTGPFFRSSETSIADIRSDIRPAIPVSDMGSVLSYLEAQDSVGEIIIIKLPDTSNFSFSGEPALVRAADYIRSPAP